MSRLDFLRVPVKRGSDIPPFMLKEDAPWKNKFYELDKAPDLAVAREAYETTRG